MPGGVSSMYVGTLIHTSSKYSNGNLRWHDLLPTQDRDWFTQFKGPLIDIVVVKFHPTHVISEVI
jgi:hypothetical protein